MEKDQKLVHYLVKSSNGSWARSDNLERALDICGVLIKKGKGKGMVRSDVQVLAWRNEHTEVNKLSEDLARYYSEHWTGGPWEAGEYWLPAVDDGGSIHALGKLELVIKNFVNE